MSTRTIDPLRREVSTMVLYVAIVLLATVAAVPTDELDEDAEVVAIVWGAAGGLALAHWFAFHVAAHLYSGGHIEADDVRSGVAQVGAALAVALVSTIPLWILGDEAGVGITVIMLAVVIALVGYTASRRGGMRPRVAFVRACVTVLLGAVVVAVKVALGH